MPRRNPHSDPTPHSHAASHQKHALPVSYNGKFMTYPNGSTIRSLCYDMIKNSTALLNLIKDSDYLPSWNLMLVSQAYENVTHVSRYIVYEARQSLSGTQAGSHDFTSLAHSYPNGHAVRSLLQSVCVKAQEIAQCVEDHDDTPAWVLMLLSQATDEISHVSSYLIYEKSR